MIRTCGENTIRSNRPPLSAASVLERVCYVTGDRLPSKYASPGYNILGLLAKGDRLRLLAWFIGLGAAQAITAPDIGSRRVSPVQTTLH